jgi:hypothetical protein
MSRLKDDKTGAIGARGPASLGAALLRRTGILTTLLLDQIEPELESVTSSDFELWLRFVLTPEESTRFSDWSCADEAGSRDLQDRFRRARDDNDLENLLRQAQSALAATLSREVGRGRAAGGAK